MKSLFSNARWTEGPKTEKLDPDEAAWPFKSDSHVIEGIVSEERPLSIMLVNLCGLEWSEIQPLLPVARDGASEQNMLAVLVVDLMDLVPLHNSEFAYDTLPNVVANMARLPDLDWSVYFERRKELLIEKWCPEAIVHLGSNRNW
ncbi:hypothetical protein [uncultured Roseibium sp.]|uniref:hypothetical protein n=1 Tax=uncultured Roseibium sp. TaxID=1936171 RepID=UPI0026035ECC|nr:hypothetical protein [uncultured Roseibium sp.]